MLSTPHNNFSKNRKTHGHFFLGFVGKKFASKKNYTYICDSNNIKNI